MLSPFWVGVVVGLVAAGPLLVLALWVWLLIWTSPIDPEGRFKER